MGRMQQKHADTAFRDTMWTRPRVWGPSLCLAFMRVPAVLFGGGVKARSMFATARPVSAWLGLRRRDCQEGGDGVTGLYFMGFCRTQKPLIDRMRGMYGPAHKLHVDLWMSMDVDM